MLVPPVVAAIKPSLLDARRRDDVAERPEGTADVGGEPPEQRDDERHLGVHGAADVEIDVGRAGARGVFGLPARVGEKRAPQRPQRRAPIAGREHRQREAPRRRLARDRSRVGEQVTPQHGIGLPSPSIHGGVGGAYLVAIGLGTDAPSLRAAEDARTVHGLERRVERVCQRARQRGGLGCPARQVLVVAQQGDADAVVRLDEVAREIANVVGDESPVVEARPRGQHALFLGARAQANRTRCGSCVPAHRRSAGAAAVQRHARRRSSGSSSRCNRGRGCGG